MASNPQPPTLRAANYDEPATFADISGIFRWIVENHMRPSLTSPPLAKDLEEFTFTYDKTLHRLYTKIDGNLKYVAFT